MMSTPATIAPTDAECAAVEAIPTHERCGWCVGFGWRILSRYSWRWSRVESQARETCAMCGGSGKRHVQAESEAA